MSDNIYIERFVLPLEDSEERIIEKRMEENDPKYGGYIDNTYPARIFPNKGLRELNFDRVTILYGGNGSGKSTLLNLIAEKLKLHRTAPYNGSELFQKYSKACRYVCGQSDDGFSYFIPNGSSIITSDDVFEYMLAIRDNNEEQAEAIEQMKVDWEKLKYGKNIKIDSIDDYDAFHTQVLARRKHLSRRQFIRRVVGTEVNLFSNGETALNYFDSHLHEKTFYCLDEPENSLSPKLQLELKNILEYLVSQGTQLVIATHSPFLLSMNGARIYNLDETPVDIEPWWELDNSKTYFNFFYNNKDLFL